MEPIILEATPETPGIILDKQNNHFKIEGKSFPEEARTFYNPIIEWLKEYAKNPNKKTELIVDMEYYNTASSKMLLEIFKTFKQIHKNGNEVEIHWHYPEDDEDMLEAGEDYEEILQIPFKYISYEEE
ncbi:MAG: DUF1987 domain-containing protein [Bacteroidota bacterium]